MGQEEHLLIISGLVPVLFFREARLQPRHEVERARVGLQIEEAGVQVEVADLLGEAVFWAAFAFGGVCCGFKRVVSMQARWFSFRRRRGVFIVAAAAARRCAAFSSSKQTSAPLPPFRPAPPCPRERERRCPAHRAHPIEGSSTPSIAPYAPGGSKPSDWPSTSWSLYRSWKGSLRTATSMSDRRTAQPTVRNFLRMPNLSAEMEWLSPVSACALETWVGRFWGGVVACVCVIVC